MNSLTESRLQIFLWLVILISNPIDGYADNSSVAAPFQLFTEVSFKNIEQKYKGQSLLIALWSLDCPPCIKELKLLSEWRQKNRDKHLVLISVDGVEFKGEAEVLLGSLNLEVAENWIFDQGSVRRLRYSVDPSWRGELPRSYIYFNDKKVAVSGMLNYQMLEGLMVES